MNTESIPQPTAPPAIQTLDFAPAQPKRLHRKIGKLPKPLRDLINTMLDDNLPAKDIIIKLNQSSDPLPYPINEMDISRWKTSGYQRYLAHQDHLDAIEASREAALELAAGNNLSLPQATLQVIASQCFEILADFSPAAIKQKLAEDPLKYTSFLHVFARLTREMVHLEKFVEARAAAQAEKPDPNRDPKAEAVDFWTRHTNALFNRKDPNRIKIRPSQPAPTPQPDTAANNNPEGVASSACEPSIPPRAIENQKSKFKNPFPSTPDPRPSCAPPASSIEHPASAPSPIQSSQFKIKNLSPSPLDTLPSEYCLECRHPLPQLTPEGKRPNERCEQCNIPLPPPGTCNRPSNDQCHFCESKLPHRLPNGRRPKPTCHVCGAHLGRELDEDIKKYAEE